MTERCTDLDEFFDGELPAALAEAFRDHLPTCERCQRVLEGRMQESVIARVPIAPGEAALTPAVTEPDPAPAAASPAPAVMGCHRAPSRWWTRSRAIAYAAPLLAAAAAVPLWCGHGDPEFALAIQRAPAAVRSRDSSPARGATLQVDDVVRPSVRGAPHRAIWVYLDERRLVAACPGDAWCSDRGGELTLELRLSAPGPYVVVGLGSRAPIAAPKATLDETLAAARRAGVYTQTEKFDVSR